MTVGAASPSSGRAPAGARRLPRAAGWSLLAAAALTLLLTMSLSLPLATFSGFGESRGVTYFHPNAPTGEGIGMLIGFIVAGAAAVTAFLMAARWLRILSGTISAMVGLWACVNGLGTAGELHAGSFMGISASPGPGAYLLGGLGVLLVLSAVPAILLPDSSGSTPDADQGPS
ncbi:hypothetical protein [Nesterenkonia sp. NBAIMH1]|uniref:hypothetical protein n=1 Tax=Nesterenkonia sp. NBAIMH1 TaxID=2600320 RepID=UPI0011B4A83E|nr:hypothetical protein [Nesterenkonia sp. NBAIMH1]